MDNGDGDTLLRIDRALDATLESVAKGVSSSIIKAIEGAIHDTLNEIVALGEKVVWSLGKTASKVIESTRPSVKSSTTGVGNRFFGILSGTGGTNKRCVILLIIMVLVYVNRSGLLKFCQRKTSESADQTTTPSTIPLTSTKTSTPTSFTQLTGRIR